MKLDPETVEALADELAERLAVTYREREGWVSADVVARHLDVEREWVYEHASKLGAVRLGDGPKARLRFKLSLVDQALAAGATCSTARGREGPQDGAVEPKRPRRRRTSLGRTSALLPIRGEQGRS